MWWLMMFMMMMMMMMIIDEMMDGYCCYIMMDGYCCYIMMALATVLPRHYPASSMLRLSKASKF